MKLKMIAARAYQHFHTAVSRKRLPLSNEHPNAIVMLVPDYGNIGDLAIGYAQERFVKRLSPTHAVQSVRISDTYKVLRALRRDLRPTDVVLLVGGGSMGDLYPRAQLGREFVARYLRPHRIVSFPQSIIYMNRPERAESERREARALSRSAEHLVLFARERQSLEVMKRFYPGRVEFAPDVVLSLTPDYQARPDLPRDSVLLALRRDVERALTDDDHAVIRNAVAPFGEIIDRDHGIPDSEVDSSSFESLPLETLDMYRRASIVVTDRLHGMIFATITGTPCIVLPNTNHKITGTYHDWIEGHCPYVRLIPIVERNALEEAIAAVTSEAARGSFRTVKFDFSALESAILGAPVR